MCECKESVYEGFPCKHELCIFLKENMNIKNLNIASRWTKEYFQLEDFSNSAYLDEVREENDEEEKNAATEVRINQDLDNLALEEEREIQILEEAQV